MYVWCEFEDRGLVKMDEEVVGCGMTTGGCVDVTRGEKRKREKEEKKPKLSEEEQGKGFFMCDEDDDGY